METTVTHTCGHDYEVEIWGSDSFIKENVEQLRSEACLECLGYESDDEDEDEDNELSDLDTLLHLLDIKPQKRRLVIGLTKSNKNWAEY